MFDIRLLTMTENSKVGLSAVVLAAYLPVLYPAVGCTWPECHCVYNAVLCVSCCTS